MCWCARNTPLAPNSGVLRAHLHLSHLHLIVFFIN